MYVTIANSTGCLLLSQIYISQSFFSVPWSSKIDSMYRYMNFHSKFHRLSTLQLLVPGTEWTVSSVVVWAMGPGQPPRLPPSSVAEDPDLQRPCPTGCSGIPLVQIMLSQCSSNFFNTYECIYLCDEVGFEF